MKRFDPYRVLKLKKSATPEEVKKAFRKAVMASHPDRGGDREKFERVKLAYHVLSDAARRRHFDETGQVLGPRPDNSGRKELEVLAQVFSAVVVELSDRGIAVGQCDVIMAMRQTLDKAQVELAAKRIRHERIRDNFLDAAGRFPPDDPLAMIARAQVTEVGRVLENVRGNTELNKAALEKLKSSTFRVDDMVHLMPSASPAKYSPRHFIRMTSV